MKPEDGDWSEATPVPIKDTKCTIPRLKEGKKYQFRVKAVNELGPGQASKSTSPVTVETQPGMYLLLPVCGIGVCLWCLSCL